MPFKSEKQRRYLWAKHPEIARKWEKEYGSKVKESIIDRIDLYLIEQENPFKDVRNQIEDENPKPEEELNLSPENMQKVIYIAKLLDKKNEIPVMKRAISKVFAERPLAEKERMLVKELVNKFFSPDKATFMRLMKKF